MCVLDASNCYDQDPRGLIFKERQQYVKSIDDLKKLEGYNNFQAEPFAQNNSCWVSFISLYRPGSVSC
jgi:hypothetical protein